MSQITKKILLLLLRGYKWAVSPMLPPSCRYVPTCSEYAAEAMERHGALRGSVLAIWRLLRCHPFAKGGFDPVHHRPRGNVRPRLACPEQLSSAGESNGSGGAKLRFGALAQWLPHGTAH